MSTNLEIITRVKELNPTIHIKKAQQSDANLFVELFNLHYKRKTTNDYFEWQFFKSPFPSSLYLAFDEHELIGFCGVKIFELTNNLKTGFIIDFLVHESYRKKGLAFLLEEKVHDFCVSHNVHGITTLPNGFGNSAFKALGFKSLSKIDTLIFDTVANGNNGTHNQSELTKYRDYTQDINFYKDQVFRKWRFDFNPLYKYEYVRLNDSTFAITKIFCSPNSEERYGDIVDIRYHNIEEASVLIELVIQNMTKKNISIITTWALKHTDLYKLLSIRGFVSRSQERFFCIKILQPEFEKIASIEKWNLVQADAEIF